MSTSMCRSLLLQGVRHRQGGECVGVVIGGPPMQPFNLVCGGVRGGDTWGIVDWSTNGNKNGTDEDDNLCVTVLIVMLFSLWLIL